MNGREYGPSPIRAQVEDVLEKINAPLKKENYISIIYSLRKKYLDIGRGLREDTPEELKDVKVFIKKEMGVEDPIIRGFAEVSKSKIMMLAITPDQESAFNIVYDVDPDSKVSYFASIETVDKKPKRKDDVLVRFKDMKSKTVNNLIISKPLANKLGTKDGKEIRILKVYQRTSEINLDEI
jgi:hypothetical protein